MSKEKLQKLKGLIREKEKTYEQCAKAIGLSTQGFQNKVSGKTQFTIEQLDKLGDFLGMTQAEKGILFLS